MEYIRNIESDIQFDFERESNVTGADERRDREIGELRQFNNFTLKFRLFSL